MRGAGGRSKWRPPGGGCRAPGRRPSATTTPAVADTVAVARSQAPRASRRARPVAAFLIRHLVRPSGDLGPAHHGGSLVETLTTIRELDPRGGNANREAASLTSRSPGSTATPMALASLAQRPPTALGGSAQSSQRLQVRSARRWRVRAWRWWSSASEHNTGRARRGARRAHAAHASPSGARIVRHRVSGQRDAAMAAATHPAAERLRSQSRSPVRRPALVRGVAKPHRLSCASRRCAARWVRPAIAEKITRDVAGQPGSRPIRSDMSRAMAASRKCQGCRPPWADGGKRRGADRPPPGFRPCLRTPCVYGTCSRGRAP